MDFSFVINYLAFKYFQENGSGKLNKNYFQIDLFEAEKLFKFGDV